MSDERRSSTVSFDEIVRIKEAAQPRLFRLPGVTCVAIGHKQRDTQLTGDLAIIVYVAAKKPLHELAPEDVVPPFIEGIPTDVLHLGPMQLLSGQGGVAGNDDDGKVLVGGMHVVSPGNGLEHGSLGCIVVMKDAQTNQDIHYILTNQHVVLPPLAEAPLGGEIRASGTECSSCTAWRVGAVAEAHVKDPVVTSFPQSGTQNDMVDRQVGIDAALVRLDPGTKWRARVVSRKRNEVFDIQGDDELLALYRQDSTKPLQNPPRVFFVGGESDYQEGIIESLQGQGDYPVPKNAKPLTYYYQITVRSLKKGATFAQQGDSGSVILTVGGNKVVGLLWGHPVDIGQDGYWRCTAIPIASVKEQFKSSVEEQYKMRIATVGEFPGVNTVPPSGNPVLASDPSAASAWAASAPLDTWSLRARIQAELLQTRGGQRYSQLILKHQQEVRTLVETNKRVAAVWRRNGGPFIVHHLVEAARHPDTPLPQVIEGQPLDAAIRNIFAILRTHGSAALVADIETHQEHFTSLIRLSYTQLLERLRTLDA